MIARIYSMTLLGLAITVATPFYFVTTDSGLTFAPALAFDNRVTPTGFGIHIALVFVALLLPVSAIRAFADRLWLRGPATWIALALVVWFTVVGVYGVYTSERPTISFLLYGQAVLPLLLFIAVANTPIEENWRLRVIFALPIASAASIILLGAAFLWQLSFNTPVRSWLFLQEAFFGVKNIQPAVSAVALAVVLAGLSSVKAPISRRALWFLFAVHAASLLMIWSRTGLVLIGVMFAVWWVWTAAEAVTSSRMRSLAPTLLATGLVMALCGIANLTFAGVSLRPEQPQAGVRQEASVPPPKPQEQRSRPGNTTDSTQGARSTQPLPTAPRNTGGPSKTVAETTESENLAGTDNRRWALLVDAMQRIRERPMVGYAFQPLNPGTTLFGVRVKSHKIYPSHNQYTGMAIRAGIPASILFVALLITLTLALKKAHQRTFEGRLAIGASALIIGLIPALFFQVYFIVSQSATVIMLLFAILLTHAPITSEILRPKRKSIHKIYSSELNSSTTSPDTPVNP
ncbi:MAG: hypothetical protein AB7O39_01060 [Flavobacteriaceae bacterium]